MRRLCGPAGACFARPLQELQRSPRPAGQAGGAREEHSWEAGMGSSRHFPARPHCDRHTGDVPSVLSRLLPTAALLKALHGKLLMCLCSLFRPLSSHWRQPCSSLGCLINSIINAERKESPRSFLIATHAREYKRPADRKQGPVPGDAPLPAAEALHFANAQLDRLAPSSRAATEGLGGKSQRGDGLQKTRLEAPTSS